MEGSERQPRAFFGRRKGHKLRPNQARLFETLLPRLALDLSLPAPAEIGELVSGSRLRGGSRNRLWRRRIDDRPGPSAAAYRLYRRRAVRQRHGQSARRHRKQSPEQCAAAFRRCGGPDRLAAGNVIGAHRPDPSRPMAETAALEASLRARRNGGAARTHPTARRRVPLCHRYRRLCRLDAAAVHPIESFRVDRRMRRRLAQAMARLYGNALSRQGRARKTGRRAF